MEPLTAEDLAALQVQTPEIEEETVVEIGPNEIQYEENANSKESRKQKLSVQHNDRTKYLKNVLK